MKSAVALKLAAEGAQIYVCAAIDGVVAWRLKGPDAMLYDDKGKPAGKHFAGPTWQANDGSAVVAEAIANSAPPRAAAIPWLLLRAKSHSGKGILSAVNYIVRMETSGGMAPSESCAAGQAGAERRVPYTAVYLFFSAAT